MRKEAKGRKKKEGRGSQKIGSLTQKLESDVKRKHQAHSSTSKCNALSTTGSTSPARGELSSHGIELSLTGLQTKLNGGVSNRPAVLNQAMKIAESGDDLASLMHIVKEWRAPDDAILSINECDIAIAIIEKHLEPCDPKVAMVLLDETLELFPVPENWDRIAKFYLEALEDIPEDLLRKTLKHVRMTQKWFPKPVELRKHAMDELFNRKICVTRFNVMKGKAEA